MISLQERLNIISQLEEEGHTQDTVESFLECYDGKGLIVNELTEEVIERIINEQED